MATLADLKGELRLRLMDVGDLLWSESAKQRFINAAIRRANDKGARRLLLDETLTVIANAVEYDLPTDIPNKQALFRVSVETETNQPYTPKYAWDVIEAWSLSGTTLKLILPRAWSETEGKTIRLEYLKRYDVLVASGDETELSIEYIMAYAMFQAFSETRTRADVDRKYNVEEAQKWLVVAEAMLKDILDMQPDVGGRVIGASV